MPSKRNMSVKTQLKEILKRAGFIGAQDPREQRFQGKARNSKYIDFLENICIDDPQLFIEITSVCNFKCSYCFSQASDRKGYMTEELFYSIIDQIADLTSQPVRLHNDGDPTVHPKFYEFAKAINDRGHSIVLVTNGFKLKPEYLSLQMSLGINLSTSPEELKSRTSVSFEKYLQVLSKYLESWYKDGVNQNISLNIYLNALERADPLRIKVKVDFAEDFLKSAGIKKYKKEENGRTVILATNSAEAKVSINLSRIASGGLYPETQNKTPVTLDRGYGFCDSPWKRLVILYDGSIQPCCLDLFGTLAMSEPRKVFDEPIKNIWKRNQKLDTLRSDFLKGKVNHETCKVCLDRIQSREFYTRYFKDVEQGYG